MICRSCGRLYFRKNQQSICLSCYTNDRKREVIYYTSKVWNKFKIGIQEKLTKEYEVILKPQLSARLERRAAIKRGLKHANNYLDKGLKLLDDFSKASKKMRFDPNGKVDLITGGLGKKDFGIITSGKTKERKRPNPII